MSTQPRSTTWMHQRRNKRRTTLMIAGFAALMLIVGACGSTDGETEVVSQPEATTTDDNGAGQDGDDDTPTTEPVAEPTEEPADPTEAPADPTVAPTSPPPTATDTPPAPTPDDPDPIPIEVPVLAGPQWYVQAVDSASGDVMPRPNGSVATIRFDQSGTVRGNAGCNDFSGEYTIDGTELSIENIAITERACLVPDWSAFVEFLPRTTGFGSAGGPDPILFVGNDSSISLGSTPPEPVPVPTDPGTSPVADYIGLTELEAAALADSRGVEFRVASIDGEAQMLTMDFIEDRVNVDLVDGVVVSGMLG